MNQIFPTHADVASLVSCVRCRGMVRVLGDGRLVETNHRFRQFVREHYPETICSSFPTTSLFTEGEHRCYG